MKSATVRPNTLEGYRKAMEKHIIEEQMAQVQGITEHMKAADQLAWVGAMNNTRNAAREVVLHNLVFQ